MVINRFDGDGVIISGSGARNRVLGNFLGTNASGTNALGNLDNGVNLSGDFNKVGGTEERARNVISGNSNNGVRIAFATNTEVLGNFIGTNARGTAALANSGNGVLITSDTSANTVGGTTRAAGNRIAHNQGDGVALVSSFGGRFDEDIVGNSVLSNRIFQNSGLGIDLGNDDITNNDRDDTTTTEPDADIDTGANNKQNFPRIIKADRDSTTGLTTITGEIESTPSTTYRIEVFLTEESPDTSGHGEGFRLLGTAVAAFDASDDDGVVPFEITDIEGLEVGDQVSATATNLATGDTSEFATNHNVT